MQLMVIGLLVLAICELPVLQAKKVVVVMPRQVRRTPNSPWRHLMMVHAKRNTHGNQGYPGQKPGHGNHVAQYYRPKDLHFAKNHYPQGGDDFDQGHEDINHVMVPHGKGISHAVSFGKGYIPFETYKDHRASLSHHHDYKHNVPSAQDVQYSPTTHFSSGPSYAQAFISQQADSYLAKHATNKDNLQDRIQDQGGQKYSNLKSIYDPSNGPIAAQYGVSNIQTIPAKQNLYPNPGIQVDPGNQGYVLRDKLVLDDYHRKVEELTKNWSTNFGGNNLTPETLNSNVGYQNHGLLQQISSSRQFDANNALQGFSGTNSFQSSLNQAQGQPGYEVKEDVVDTPHDFRTMPIQTTPLGSSLNQPLLQNGQQIQQPVRHILQQQQPLQQQIIQQQPVQQSLQHVFPQSPTPANYPVQYQDFIHG